MVTKDAKTGVLSGHMIEALELILGQVGAVPEYHEQAWGTAALGLQSRVCDLLVTGFFVKIPRAFAVSFTRPLLYLGDAVLVRKGEERFRNIEEVDSAEVTVAVATGESGHEYAKQHLKLAHVRNIDVEGGDLSRIFLEVSTGTADIAIADSWNIAQFADRHEGVEARFVENSFNMNAVAWAARHEDQSLLRFVENSLTVLDTNGTLRRLEKKYKAHWMHERKSFGVYE